MQNRRIILAITGGIAAYKTPQLVRELRAVGAEVRVVLSDNAARLVAPLALQAVSGHPVQTSLWEGDAGFAMDHIELAKWADAILIAPATANFIAKLAAGAADDLLTTLVLATEAPIFIAPAMNQAMWKHVATKANIKTLQAREVTFLGPESGEQACGDVGPGRMREPADLVADLEAYFAGSQTWGGKRLLITAGPTRERWDPVRFLTNRSTGRMGFAIAAAMQHAGAEVTLIAGPVQLATPPGVTRIDVVTAKQMAQAVRNNIENIDVFISTAAVADFRPQQVLDSKLKKNGSPLTLSLEPTEDIVATVTALEKKPTVIGFAAETHNVLPQARAKRLRKKMDYIIANEVGNDCGFGDDEPTVWVLGEDCEVELSADSKESLAPMLVETLAEHAMERSPNG